jgi:hypothetical protein
MTCKTIGGVRVATADGQRLEMEADALALISKALEQKAKWLVVPVEDIAADFFRLRTGLAGAVCQKFVTYGVGLAIMGDVSVHESHSNPFRGFIDESNDGRHVWFVKDVEELKERLGGRGR